MSMAFPDVLVVSKTLFGFLLLGTSLTMAVIDFRETILPNRLNFLLAAGGVGQALLLGRPNLLDAGLGAGLGFVTLSVIAALFRHLRGIDGLGFGDQKFSAAAGLWIGWEEIARMLLIASCSALLFALLWSLRGRKFDKVTRIPFGPFLGFGVVVCWLMTIAPGS